MNNKDIICNFEKLKSKSSQIQRKHKNQNPKEKKLYDIRERSFQFFDIGDLVSAIDY
ncbi:hypothetical protein [[Eubacterium] cellulosolvens]